MHERYTRRNYEDESSITDACSAPYNLEISVQAHSSRHSIQMRDSR